MAIKIRIKTEGDHREPYEFEAEITQDTIVASMDLVNALASAAIQNEQMRDRLMAILGDIGSKFIQARIMNPDAQRKFFETLSKKSDVFKHDNVEPKKGDDNEE
jgi:hypothetical protein